MNGIGEKKIGGTVRRVLVVGAGGFGREVMQYLRDMVSVGEPLEVAGFLDDNPHALSAAAKCPPIVGSIEAYQPRADEQLVLAVSDPAVRYQMAERLSARGGTFCTVVHPRAYVAESAEIGDGCVLAPFAFVGPGARLGRHVVLNTYASVGHDACIDDLCVFSPYAVVNGNVRLRQQVFLGTHATVILGKTVGSYAKISAGSVATRDVPEGALVVGNPGKSRVLFAKGNEEV